MTPTAFRMPRSAAAITACVARTSRYKEIGGDPVGPGHVESNYLDRRRRRNLVTGGIGECLNSERNLRRRCRMVRL